LKINEERFLTHDKFKLFPSDSYFHFPESSVHFCGYVVAFRVWVY